MWAQRFFQRRPTFAHAAVIAQLLSIYFELQQPEFSLLFSLFISCHALFPFIETSAHTHTYTYTYIRHYSIWKQNTRRRRELEEKAADEEKEKTSCTAFPFFSVAKSLMKADLYLLVRNMLHVCYIYVQLPLCGCVPSTWSIKASLTWFNLTYGQFFKLNSLPLQLLPWKRAISCFCSMLPTKCLMIWGWNLVTIASWQQHYGRLVWDMIAAESYRIKK